MKIFPTFANFVIVSSLAILFSSYIVGHVNAAVTQGCTGNPHDFDSGPTGNPHDGRETGNPHDHSNYYHEVERCPGAQ